MPRAAGDPPTVMQLDSSIALRSESRELVAVYGLSRTIGLLREIGVAAAFGTTLAADRLSAGLVVASLAALMLSEAVFATQVRRKDDAGPVASLGSASTAARAGALSLAYVVPGVIVSLAILPSQPLRDLLAITLCLAPSVGCVAAAGVPNALLTLGGRIARVNLAQTCWSAGALLGLLAEHELGGGVAVVAAGWSAGTLCGLLLATRWARRLLPGARTERRSAIDLRVAGPVALAFGLIALQGLVDRGIAARLGEGAVAALGYADRLFALPVGFVMSAIAPGMLAAVIARRRQADGSEGAAVVQTSARLLRLALPASFLLFAACPLVVDAVLGYGAFDARSAELTVAALDGLAISIGATSLSLLLYRAMQAVLPLGELARVAGAALSASALLSIALAVPLGLRGVTLGTALAAALAVALQARRLGAVFGDDWQRLFGRRVLSATICWTAVGAVVCAAVSEAAWLRPAACILAVMSFATLSRRQPC